MLIPGHLRNKCAQRVSGEADHGNPEKKKLLDPSSKLHDKRLQPPPAEEEADVGKPNNSKPPKGKGKGKQIKKMKAATAEAKVKAPAEAEVKAPAEAEGKQTQARWTCMRCFAKQS